MREVLLRPRLTTEAERGQDHEVGGSEHVFMIQNPDTEYSKPC